MAQNLSLSVVFFVKQNQLKMRMLIMYLHEIYYLHSFCETL